MLGSSHTAQREVSMKLLIVSDLHGNSACIQAILNAEKDIGAVYAAGDFVDYGPDPVPAIDLARKHGFHCVRGNHDERVLRFWNEGGYVSRPDGECTWADINCRRLDREHIAWLSALPETLSFTSDGIAYLMAHSISMGYDVIENASAFDRFWKAHFDLPGCGGMQHRMIFGHTHRQMLVQLSGDRLWMNPGSASYRRQDDPSKDAFYIIIDNGNISLRQVPYEHKRLREETLRLKQQLTPAEFEAADFFFCGTDAPGGI